MRSQLDDNVRSLDPKLEKGGRTSDATEVLGDLAVEPVLKVGVSYCHEAQNKNSRGHGTQR